MRQSWLLQLSGVVADLIYSVQQVPEAGEEAIVKDFSILPGGGFNAMVAASRSNMPVCYGGSVGAGPFAEVVIRGLNSEGIPFLQSQDLSRDQGCCSVLVDTQGERTFISSDGAEGHVTAETLAQIPFHNYDWTLLSGYTLHYKGARGALRGWLEGDAPVEKLVFDPSPVIAALKKDDVSAALSRAHWVSANVREAAVLTGLSDPKAAAEALAADRPEGGGAIVRNGRSGCIVATGKHCETIPALPVNPVDTNGAGDAHIGSFIAELARTRDPLHSARYANAAAGLSTTVRGPATAPLREQIEQAMKGS